jgi:hypothetical protein
MAAVGFVQGPPQVELGPSIIPNPDDGRSVCFPQEDRSQFGQKRYVAGRVQLPLYSYDR